MVAATISHICLLNLVLINFILLLTTMQFCKFFARNLYLLLYISQSVCFLRKNEKKSVCFLVICFMLCLGQRTPEREEVRDVSRS